MTTVHIARTERLFPPDQPTYDRLFTHVLVLADDAGRRELPVWLLGADGRRLTDLLERPAGRTPDSGYVLTPGLLGAAGADVTTVDIDELGPEVTAARIGLAGPSGTQAVTARLVEGLAVAIATGAPIRVADAVMDRLAAPARDDGRAGPGPAPAAAPTTGTHGRPRYEPRNLAFGDGLDGWIFDGSFSKHASEAHWRDYSFAAADAGAVIGSAVTRPEGFAMLRQAIFADDYRGATVTFRGEFRAEWGGGDGPGRSRDASGPRSGTAEAPGRAGVFLRVNLGPDIRGPLTYGAALTGTDHNVVAVAADRDWTGHEVTARVPEEADTVVFGVFLAGRGRIELRNLELIRG